MIFLIIFFFLILFIILNNEQSFENINNNNKLCCIYAYYEKNEKYKNNLEYFLLNGIYEEVDYYFIINGKCTLNIQETNNIKIFKRENKGYDFGAWSHCLNKLEKKYDYYTFINSSVKGPYLYYNIKWYEPFLKLFNKDVKIVGTTINILPLSDCGFLKNIDKFYGHNGPYTHIQSMFFIIDSEYLNYLKSIDFFNEEKINNIKNFFELILKYEIGLSQYAIKKGWNINCILEPYRYQDYRKIDISLFGNYIGDIYYYKRYFGKTINPYNVIFFKTNRL